MAYTEAGFTNEDVKTTTRELKQKYPNKKVVVAIRAWKTTETSLAQLKESIRNDIRAALDAGADGYALFTYEALLELKDTLNAEATHNQLSRIKNEINF